MIIRNKEGGKKEKEKWKKKEIRTKEKYWQD
jgi:hypothetical protein